MQSLSFAASPRAQSEEQCPAFGLGQLEDMMKIADPVCFGSFVLSIDPTKLFQLTFAEHYEKFVTELNSLTRQSLSSVHVSDWMDCGFSAEQENVSSFKRRTVKISRRNVSPWSWVNNKPVESMSQQYSIHRQKGWTVYCISHSMERRAIRVIEKFEVEALNPTNQTTGVLSPRRQKKISTDRLTVRVIVSASAHYSDGFPPSFVAFTKATSSCRFQYGKWKQLVLELVSGGDRASGLVGESVIQLGGKWNKLSSYDQITLLPDQNRLVHFDGHSFPFQISTQTESQTTVSARYGDRVFGGTIVHDVPDEIKWSNGSVWIKDGFRPFVGSYRWNEKRMEFLDTGEVVSSDGTKFHAVLCGRNEIERASSGRVRNFAELIHGKLIWNTDEVWERIEPGAQESQNDENKQPEQQNSDVSTTPPTKKERRKNGPKVPTMTAPPIPIAPVSTRIETNVENESDGVARGGGEEDLNLVAASPIENVIVDSDDEPSGSQSYSISGEKILQHDLENTEEFEGWLVVSEYL